MRKVPTPAFRGCTQILPGASFTPLAYRNSPMIKIPGKVGLEALKSPLEGLANVARRHFHLFIGEIGKSASTKSPRASQHRGLFHI
ncbi:hypothetical protein DP23_4321 [Ralstonia pickettii]|nr:hypothetical protein DP23_4321 [Ralstonia pickettii]